MKKILFLILAISYSFVSGQEFLRIPQGLSIKLHSRMVTAIGDDGIVEPRNIHRLRPIYPAISFQTEKGHFHLVEVSNLNWDSFEQMDNNWNELELSLAYEYAFPLIPLAAPAIWRPYLGFGLNHSFSRFWINPRDPGIFVQKNLSFRSDFYLFPSVYKAINERLFFDLAFQVHIGTFEGLRFVSENPVSPGPTNFSEIRSTLFRKLGARFGFGVKL